MFPLSSLISPPSQELCCIAALLTRDDCGPFPYYMRVQYNIGRGILHTITHPRFSPSAHSFDCFTILEQFVWLKRALIIFQSQAFVSIVRNFTSFQFSLCSSTNEMVGGTRSAHQSCQGRRHGPTNCDPLSRVGIGAKWPE
jgi:hypothetical protein